MLKVFSRFCSLCQDYSIYI